MAGHGAATAQLTGSAVRGDRRWIRCRGGLIAHRGAALRAEAARAATELCAKIDELPGAEHDESDQENEIQCKTKEAN